MMTTLYVLIFVWDIVKRIVSVRLFFSDETTFQVNGKVNKQNVRIWGVEKNHCYQEHVRVSPKMNVFCSVAKSKDSGPFSFTKQTRSAMIYLDMITELLLFHLKHEDDFQYSRTADRFISTGM